MTTLRQGLTYLRAAIVEKRRHVYAYLAASVLGVLGLQLFGSGAGWDFVERVLLIATLGAAVTLWIGEARQDWENGLPKLLTAAFVFPKNGNKENIRFLIRRTYLVGSADIRAWALSLGGQMNDNKKVDFYQLRFLPQKILDKKSDTTIRDNPWVRRFAVEYTVVFTLDATGDANETTTWDYSTGHRVIAKPGSWSVQGDAIAESTPSSD